MSNAHKFQEFLGEPHQVCSMCGKRKPDGFWGGPVDIWACKFCAVDILPKLMADSVVYGAPGGKPSWREIQKAMQQVERNFYYACTIALTQSLKEKKVE